MARSPATVPTFADIVAGNKGTVPRRRETPNSGEKRKSEPLPKVVDDEDDGK